MENIINHFFEFETIEKVVPFGSGHINDTYKIGLSQKGGKKYYIFQKFNHRVFKKPFEVMENIGLIAGHLLNTNYPYFILRPYRTSKGNYLFATESGEYWRAFDFFENTISFDQVDTAERAYEAAKAYGVFVRSLEGLDVGQLNITIPDFHNGEKRLTDFKMAVKKAINERREKAADEIADITAHQMIFEKIHHLPLPLRAVHHDTKINNVLFDEKTKKAVAVIDLDTAMPGTVLSDFGDMVRTFTNSAGEDEADLTKVKMRKGIYLALEKGFLSAMDGSLTEAEKGHLKLAGPWLTLMQAIRFLGDYLIGDAYYKIKYPTHNLVRARNQLALFHSMKKNLEIEDLFQTGV